MRSTAERAIGGPFALAAAVAYAAIVFAIGFVIGAVRVFLVVPQIGETAAVALEAPVMLAVSWFVSRWVMRRFHVSRSVVARVVVGFVAFCVLQLLEFGLAVVIFHRTPESYVAAYANAPGLIGLGAQIVFAVFPLMQRGRA